MVSHAISHPSITTTVEKQFHLCDTSAQRELNSREFHAIISINQLWQKSSQHTCTQCVQMGHSHHSQILGWSDRASITSIVCWKTISRNSTCKSNNYFLPFQSVQHLFVFHEAPYIALSIMGKSKPSSFEEYNGLEHLLCTDIWTTNNAYSAKG